MIFGWVRQVIGRFRSFRLGSSRFGWVRMVSGGFVFYQLRSEIQSTLSHPMRQEDYSGCPPTKGLIRLKTNVSIFHSRT